MIIEMFPAENGDAFLIRLDNGKNIVIDMGYATTYTNFIKDRFIDLNNKIIRNMLQNTEFCGIINPDL